MQSEQQQRIMGYFIEEAKDHLNTIEQGLLNLQNTIEDPEMVSEVFRAAHSVKGGAAMLGLGSIQQTSHRLEDYFKVLKECTIRVDQKLESLFLRVFDTLQELLEQLQGPFGLTEDKANEVMADVEPVFASLNEHLTQLVSQAGGVPPEEVDLIPISGFPTTSPPIPATAPAAQTARPEESALQLIFKSDVPVRLREMLQLFKQVDDFNSRQQLQTICQSLTQAGEQFDLPTWCELLAVAQRAIANEDNTYRTLAPIIIRDIKQAQELVLAGKVLDIQASEGLRSLLPPELEVLPDIAIEDDFASLLAEIDFEEDSSIPEFIEFDLESEEPSLTPASAQPNFMQGGGDWFNVTTAIQMDDEPDTNTGLEDTELNFNVTSEVDVNSLNESLDTAPAGDQHGPEVGIAELNSLADLFEGEVPDLGMTWQEEEIISDTSADMSNSATFNASNDFSDLLFDEDGLEDLDLEEQQQNDDLSDLLNVSQSIHSDEESPTESTGVDNFEPSDLLASLIESDWHETEPEDISSGNLSSENFWLESDTSNASFDWPTDIDAVSPNPTNSESDELNQLFSDLDSEEFSLSDSLDNFGLEEESAVSSDASTDADPGEWAGFASDASAHEVDNPFEIVDFFGSDDDLATTSDFQSDLDNPFTLSDDQPETINSEEGLTEPSHDDALVDALVAKAEVELSTGEPETSSSYQLDPWAALDAEDDILSFSEPVSPPSSDDDDLMADLWADSTSGADFNVSPTATLGNLDALDELESSLTDDLLDGEMVAPISDPFAQLEDAVLETSDSFQFLDLNFASEVPVSSTEPADSEANNNWFEEGSESLVANETNTEALPLEESSSIADSEGTPSLDTALDLFLDASLHDDGISDTDPDLFAFSESLADPANTFDLTETSDTPIEAVEMDLAALLDEVTEEDIQLEAIAADPSDTDVTDESEPISNLFDDNSLDSNVWPNAELAVLSTDSVSPEADYTPETSEEPEESFELPNLADDLFGSDDDLDLMFDDGGIGDLEEAEPTVDLDANQINLDDMMLDFTTGEVTDSSDDFDTSLDAIDFGNFSLALENEAFSLATEGNETDELELAIDIPESEITETENIVDFDQLDSLLSDESVDLRTPQSDVVSPPSAPNTDLASLTDLDVLLSGVADTTDPLALDDSLNSASGLGSDEFVDLDALLMEEPTSPFHSDAEGDQFADLEALLGTESQSSASETSFTSLPPQTSSSMGSDFDDLEKLLEDADQTLGGPPTARGARGPSLTTNRNKTRPTRGILNDQTMRVSVKNLDNLNNLVGELVVNRNSLEQAEERLRQFLDNLLYQVQQLSDVGQRMRDLYERSLLESSLLSSRKTYQMTSTPGGNSGHNHATGVSFDALEMDRFTGFHTLSQEMIELIVRVRESASDIDFVVDETDQVTRNFRQITTQLQEGLTRSRMVPFAQTADRLPRAVRDISLKCGKQAELSIEGRETLIDKMILEQLYDPMTHLVNNAITHGIETPEERIANGKPATGRIIVRTFHQGNQTVISVTDDGAGIDPDIVKRKAIEKGLISPSESATMSRLDVYDLLFHHGFSTKDKADDFAGRGVGMDVVRTSLNEIRGVINIDSTIGKGTTFTIRLPLTLSISKALCCISNRARIAFPMDGVEDMLDVPKERILRDDHDRPCIQWRDQLLPFQPLSELLKYNRSLGRGSVYGGNQEDDIVSVVVLRSNAGNFLALQVDQVLGEQEIVIKQLEGPVPKPIGVAGATVLGDGRIMPIADVLELIDLSMGRIRREAGSSLWEKDEDELPPDTAETKTEPTVLIVDDSITVRELLSMTFNKVGYRVEQARDGQEAWEKLRSGLPCDLVFCDIEMPRMDGLELLSRIQKDPSLAHMPIAMLTSRGADRHRQMAIQLGAKGYFTKPYLEEALLDAAQRMLKGEVLVNNG
jgi:chemotaxis protein histidine kinase CheA/CheY-like chemotaxis protein